MQTKSLGERFLIRLEAGEEVIASLKGWAEARGIGFAALSAIGALERATIAYFDAGTKAYRHLPVEEHVEVVSLIGNVSRGEDGGPVVHAHAVLGRADGSTLGGHLMEGVVQPTLEVILDVQPGRVQRQRDPASGLALWELSEG